MVHKSGIGQSNSSTKYNVNYYNKDTRTINTTLFLHFLMLTEFKFCTF